MRKYGGLASLLPFTSVMLLIGSLSLMGFPFLTGFYSKDLILEIAFTKYTIEGSFAYIFGLITAFFTSYYSFRVFYMTFLEKNKSFRTVMSHIHELPLNMAIALMVLSLGSIFFGYLAKDFFVGLGTDFWNHSILILDQNNNQLDAEFFGLPNLSLSEAQVYMNQTYKYCWIKLLPFFSSIFAVFLVFFFFHPPFDLKFTMFDMRPSDSERSFSFDVYHFLNYKWYFDAIYNERINRPILNLAYVTIFKSLDKGLLELFGPYGTSFALFFGAAQLKKMQLGKAYYYAYLMIAFLLVSLIVWEF